MLMDRQTDNNNSTESIFQLPIGIESLAVQLIFQRI